MPIHEGYENGSMYYQWGEHGKKYFYDRGNEEAKQTAYSLALRQQKAIYASRSRRR